jgi:hypothetical protein
MSQNRASICVALAIASAVLLPATVVSAADETFAPTTVISLPGGQKVQSFDISFADPVTGIYILGDRTNKAVDVIDTTTNTVLTQLMAASSALPETTTPRVRLLDHVGPLERRP